MLMSCCSRCCHSWLRPLVDFAHQLSLQYTVYSSSMQLGTVLGDPATWTSGSGCRALTTSSGSRISKIGTYAVYTVMQSSAHLLSQLQQLISSSAHSSILQYTVLHDVHDCIHCIALDWSPSPRRSRHCILQYTVLLYTLSMQWPLVS